MNPAFLKGSAALAAASGSATAGAYFAGAFNGEDKSFRNYLKTIKRDEASTSEDWAKLKELYSSDSNADRIPNITKENLTSNIKPLSDWCESKLKSNYNDAEKNLVESWCSKSVKISERLSYFGLSSLNTATTGGTTNADDSTWDTKSSKYGADTTSDATLKIHEINNGSSAPKTLGNELGSTATKEQLKKWCDWAKDQAYQHEESVLFKRYKHWCTKK
ncbi:hypothetical protein HF1_06530 [Mycoplasma haemofelis str. Langford 1]|uniref:Lipoprotein n=2 Tax=Mycoplasma haemofelis TaxID=29501 RepID=F6FIE8_MYCHI|nr:hypothetical protein [Mycoplasma haemofelis]AEG72996.1 hypothetical protein MHF_0726 [Mycoplasma haemofelis Ohio2]CBY92661.1 hypothetical protein HF1_06530 [Mycoplasma haemofelis str. Langford 1]